MPCAREPVAEPAAAAVEQEEREADDDRRERERQVDERVQEPLEREVAPHDREADDDPEDGVHGHRDRGHEQRDLERVDRRVVRERVPDVACALVERPPAHDHDRSDQDRQQVEERDAAQGEPADAC